MASQSRPITEPIKFPTAKNAQPTDKEPNGCSGSSPREVPQADSAGSEADGPREVVLTYWEFDEIRDCSQGIFDSLRLFRQTTRQMGDGIEAIAICSQHLDRLVNRISNRLAGVDD